MISKAKKIPACKFRDWLCKISPTLKNKEEKLCFNFLKTLEFAETLCDIFLKRGVGATGNNGTSASCQKAMPNEA
jgi:hypothetical protein